MRRPTAVHRWSFVAVAAVAGLITNTGVVMAQDDFDFNTTESEFPTLSPTPFPTFNVTNETTTPEPSASPSFAATELSTPRPTFAATLRLQEHTVEDLSMKFFGISEQLSTAEVEAWEQVTGAFQEDFWSKVNNTPFQEFEAVVSITKLVVPTPAGNAGNRGRGLLRQLQDGDSDTFLTIYYQHTMNYRLKKADPDGSIDPQEISLIPFERDTARNIYVAMLQDSNEGILADITSASAATADSTLSPTAAPATTSPTNFKSEEGDDLPLTLGAIIGIAVGGAFCLLGILFFLCCRSSENEYTGANNDMPTTVINGMSDDVSTLAPPPISGRVPNGYGDQSVATVDYDYSKAYGGAGDAVSSAGGTFGSQPGALSVFDSRMSGPSGAALGSFSDVDSFDAGHRDAGGATKDIVLNIFAPPGKLGVVIDTPDDGAPVVHAVKDTSIIADQINVGDKLIAVDDEDVRSMTAIKVSKLISRKSANPSRKLTIVRTVAQ